jgi:hypothetical protein
MRHPKKEDSFFREFDSLVSYIMWLKMKPPAQGSISDRDKFSLCHWIQNDAEV